LQRDVAAIVSPQPGTISSAGGGVESLAAAAAGGSAAVFACAAVLRATRKQRRHSSRFDAAVAVRRCASGGDTVTLERDARKVPEGLEGQVVDEEAMLAMSSFPIKPDEVIQKCKEVLGRGVGTLAGGEADLADDFEFCAPVVGPIGKEPYMEALGTFKIGDAFPDSNPNYHFFRVDPFEPDRVWFQTRKTGTNTGEFMNKPATGKALVFPPEAYSMRFNADGKVTEFTVGYPMDRRIGNTGGLGGAFGYFYGVGNPLPIPECQPYKRSWQFRFLNWVSRTTKRFQGVKVKKQSP